MTVHKKIPNAMTAVLLTGIGGPEKLEIRNDVPVPKPSRGQVLIQVLAVITSNDDDNQLQQKDEDEVEEEVQYFGSECDGGFAQYTIANTTDVYPITCSTLTDVELASFPCSYSTAENLLTRSNCCTKDIVLVTGASGGVGSAVVQLAKHCRGVKKVIAVCSGSSKADQVKSLGADIVLDRNDNLVERLGADSVTLIIDLVGGGGGGGGGSGSSSNNWGNLLDLLKRGVGRYATAGAIGGPLVQLDLRTLYLKDLTLMGCTALDDGVFTNLVEHINTGKVKPVVAATYPLEEIGRAQGDFMKKKHVGKLVLVPPPPSPHPNHQTS